MATTDLAIDARAAGAWDVVTVRGEVDIATSPQLRDVPFLDSSGLGVLVAGHRRSRERGGELAIVCAEGPVMRVLAITGLDRVFPIHGSPGDVIGD